MSSGFTVPKFSNVFSPIENLINKGFPCGDVSLQMDTLTSNGVKITASGLKNNDTGAIKSNLGLSYDSKAHGVTLSSVWRQTNVADFSLLIKNALFPEANVELSGSLADSKSSAGLGISYLHSAYALTANYQFSSQISFAKADLVTGKNGFVVGGSMKYDVYGAQTSAATVMSGYISPEFTLLFKWNNCPSQFTLMGLHRVSRRVEVAWKGYNLGQKTNENFFEVGAKYLVDPNTTVKAKVDNDGKLCVGLILDVNDNLTTTLGAKVDTKSLEKDNHKLGASFTLKM